MRAAYRFLLPSLLAAVVTAAENRVPPGLPLAGEQPPQRTRRLGPVQAPPLAGNAGKGAAAPAPPAKGKPKATAPAAPAVAAPELENPIDADTIILVNEQRFLGTVLSDQPDPEQVAINTGSGVMNFRRSLVARIEYGLVVRMARVKDDDFAGLVDLAYWCRTNKRNPEALQLLTKAIALPGCDLKTRGFYAQLVDEIDGPDKALPLYVAYRNAGGTDADILARLDQLEKANQAWEEQMRALGLDPGASAEAGKPVEAAATASKIEEGLEKYSWTGDDPKWANPVVTSQPTILTDSGPRRILQVDYLPNPNDPKVDKAAVVLRPQGGLNVRANSKLTMLAANRGTKDVRIGIAVKTGTDWTYFESQAVPLAATSSGQDFVQLSFDLGAATYKAASTNWAHAAKVTGLEQLREVQILIHNGREKGSLWLAGVAFSD